MTNLEDTTADSILVHLKPKKDDKQKVFCWSGDALIPVGNYKYSLILHLEY